MLLTKFIEINITKRNQGRYKKLGYDLDETTTSLNVRVEHLPIHSPETVEVLCDYCLSEDKETLVKKAYANYLSERETFEKDCCSKCRYKKSDDALRYKQENNLLLLDDRGYFNFKENRLKELKRYIEKYKVIDKMDDNIEGRRLYSTILKFKEKPYELAEELGYEIDDIMIRKPNGYYNDFKNLEKSILKIKQRLKRFPNNHELKQELHIDQRYIKYHGGYYTIRRKMGYESDLVDSTGFYNSSSYEYEVANFLINNNIKFKREQYPFTDEKFRSDFTIYIDNKNIINDIHIEVWGYLKTNDSKIANDYNKVRIVKENLYQKNNIPFISIEPEMFVKKKNSQIKNSLNKIFRPFMNSSLKCSEYEVIAYPKDMKDEDLYNELCNHMHNDILPTTVELRKVNSRLYTEIIKRFDTYNDFTMKYLNQKAQYKPTGYWTKEKIFEIFDFMLRNYNKILSRKEAMKLRDVELIKEYLGIEPAFSKKFGGVINLKLDYYLEKANKKNTLPQHVIDWLNRCVVNITRRGNALVTPKQQEQARQILDKYYSNQLTNAN